MKTLFKYTLFYACIFFFLSEIAQAQPVCQIQHYSTYSGLPQRTVVNIVQDGKGFIWLSTWNGLSKFDGYSFKNYKAYPGDGCTLTSNRLYSITANQHGDIWCQTYDSRIYLFDSRREKFIDVLKPFETQNNVNYSIRQIYALAKGVTWIVFDHGAFRVNEGEYKKGESKGVTLYSSKAGNLPGKDVVRVLQDKDGDEWIFTDKGIQIVGKKTMPGNTSFKNACENGNNMYLLSANNRLAVYDLRTEQLKFLKIPYDDIRLNSIQNLGKDTIGLGAENGIILFDVRKKNFKYVAVHFAAENSNVQNIFRDSHGELWIFSDAAGVNRYNLRTGEIEYYQTPAEDMPNAERQSNEGVFEDAQGRLWVIPQMGCLSYYDRKSKQLKPYYTDYNDPKSKFTPIVLRYLLDNQKNFWYTNNYEMGKISFFPSACVVRPLDSGYETRAFLKDSNNNFWMANKKGFIRIFNEDGSFKGYLTPSGSITEQTVSFARNIYCFMEDKQGGIWMGTKWDGVFRLKKTGNNRFIVQQFSHKADNPFSLSNNSVYSIFQDSNQRIWIGTYGGGLNLLEENKDGEVRFIHSGNLLKNYPQNKYTKVRIIKEVDKALLVGTTEGLLSMCTEFKDAQKINFYQNIRRQNITSSLCSNDVTSIYTDSRGQTFVLTFTGGVNQIVSRNLLTNNIQFKTYTRQNGLFSDLVLSMVEDPQRNLWVISEDALSKFNAANGTFDNYDKRYLQKEVYFSEAIPVVWHGHLMLGTEGGVMEMNPALLSKSKYIPRIAFTGLKIQGVQESLDIDDLKELELQPSQRNVTFQFAALDYIDPSAIQYAYRLKGLEEQWNEVDNNRSANYINLPPGEYELQIRSTNSDGVWTDNMRTLSVVVIPTFWETYWAWALYVFLFILFTTAIVYTILYIYRLHNQINLEHQLSNIKLRFFTDISHELRTPLTLISSPVTEVLEHESLSPTARKHLTLVHKNTERMLRLVNQILDFRKIENRKMKLLLERTDVIILLERVMDNFRLIAEEKHIDFRLHSQTDNISGWIDQDKFEKVMFNLISNAFKYTPDHKSIAVWVSVKDETLVLSVKDEGIGIDLKKQQSLFQRFETLVRYNILQPSSGIGLSLVRELVELHQGSIEVNSQPDVGSEFLVTLPLSHRAYEGKENTEFIVNDSLSTEQQEAAEACPDTCTEVDDQEKELVSVLIVEDNSELRTFLYDILSETYKVIEATNGQEGLQQAVQYMPDFIISDIMMPMMDGLDMVKAIKCNRDICHIPIILLSAKSSLDDRISGLEQGIDDYVTKPFSSTYLKARIKSLLNQRKQLQELYLKQWSERKLGHSIPVVPIEPPQPEIVCFDELFMQQVMEVMEKQMDNSELTVDRFAQELAMGRTVFYQKLKAIIGLSPVDFIREMRIKRAKQLMESGEYNVSSVAYMTGFNDPKYFSKCFKKQFGMSPSEYGKERKQND
ncbi:MAG: two-component regulator propeller domain-containing protein [Bacteroides graminisolvens]|jgi:signal transduction histidine kinase/ligand-binding sensor domain-containing protein/DNA-binding response OmpR family regulator|nr:response regulator [Parabacteroides sp.]